MLCDAGLHLRNIKARNVLDGQHAVMRLNGLLNLAVSNMDTTNEARSFSACSSSTLSRLHVISHCAVKHTPLLLGVHDEA